MSKNGHAARKQLDEKRSKVHAAAASKHNELHATFFGVPNIPVREIRARLDPVLQMHAVREITKIYLGDKEGDDDA
jgi:hypothetical protein